MSDYSCEPHHLSQIEIQNQMLILLTDVKFLSNKFDQRGIEIRLILEGMNLDLDL